MEFVTTPITERPSYALWQLIRYLALTNFCYSSDVAIFSQHDRQYIAASSD